jgi:hypothetical protein
MKYAAKSQIYDNCIILAPDGEAVARCQKKRLDWFLERNLATKVCDNPLTIKLHFEPKSRYHKEEATQIKFNRCVVCGATKNINRHHIIPACFRHEFPPEIRSCKEIYHDVVVMCINCHAKYEKSALELKKELAIKFNISLHGINVEINPYRTCIASYARTLLKYEPVIPHHKAARLKERIRKFLDKKELSKNDLEEAAKLNAVIKLENYISYGKYIVMNCEIKELILLWRKHFLEIMEPKFMGDYWQVDRLPS